VEASDYPEGYRGQIAIHDTIEILERFDRGINLEGAGVDLSRVYDDTAEFSPRIPSFSLPLVRFF